MERDMLPGEKRIYSLTLRVEEMEWVKLQEKAESRGVDRSIVHRDALRKYLELEAPTNEHFSPPRKR